MADTTFIDRATPIQASWLNDVNDFVYNGANQVQTGQFYKNLGARINRFADRIFVGDAVVLDGNQPTATGTWVKSVSSGIYEYLENAATTVSPAFGAGIGIFSAARSSTGSGLAGAASIGVAGFAYNDFPTGAAGVWALYGTALRATGVGGATHGLELDIGHIGTTVPLFPASMIVSGQSHGAWVCSGGESTATPGLVGTASVAIGIFSNDPLKAARFDKGIVFENKSISGTDGATGNGIAMAFASGHQQIWFNNSNQVVGEFVTNAKTASNAVRIDLSDFGFLVQDRTTGGNSFQVQTVANSANYLTALGVVAGSSPQLVANGAGANLDLILQPKGTGNVQFGTFTAGSFAQTGYITIKDIGGTIRRLMIG